MNEPTPERWAKLCSEFRKSYVPAMGKLEHEWWRMGSSSPECDPQYGPMGRGCHEHRGPMDRGRWCGHKDKESGVYIPEVWHCETCLLFGRPSSNFPMCFDQIETCIGIGADDVGHKGGLCDA